MSDQLAACANGDGSGESEPSPPPILKKDAPHGFDPVAFELQLKKLGLADTQKDGHRFWALHGKKEGVFGCRKGNAHRWSRRRWIETYLFVKSKNGEVVPFKLNDSQRRLDAEVTRMERTGIPVRLVILKARQQGFSTYVAALALWYALTRQQGRACIVAHRRETSKVIFMKVRLMMRSMPKKGGKRWDFSLLSDSGSQLILDDPILSQVIVDSAEVKEPGRGDTVQVLHESESPSWKDASAKIAALRQILPSEPDTYGFCESTARGDANQFAKEFKAAWKINRHGKPIQLGWRAIFFPWFYDQEYRLSHVQKRPFDESDAEWVTSTLDDEEKLLLTQRYLRRGHGFVTVDLDQIAWRRYALRELCQRDMNKLHEEYPSTPEEAFIASGARFFDPLVLAERRDQGALEPVWRGELVDPEGDAIMMRRLPELFHVEHEEPVEMEG